MLCIEDFDYIAARGSNDPAVPHLAAGLAIEWRLRGQQIDFLAFNSFRFAAAVAENPKYFRFSLEAIVADEAYWPVELDLRFHAGDFAGFAATISLFFHEPVEAGLVDVDIFGASKIFRQIEGEPIGIANAQGDIAG